MLFFVLTALGLITPPSVMSDNAITLPRTASAVLLLALYHCLHASDQSSLDTDDRLLLVQLVSLDFDPQAREEVCIAVLEPAAWQVAVGGVTLQHFCSLPGSFTGCGCSPWQRGHEPWLCYIVSSHGTSVLVFTTLSAPIIAAKAA